MGTLQTTLAIVTNRGRTLFRYLGQIQLGLKLLMVLVITGFEAQGKEAGVSYPVKSVLAQSFGQKGRFDC